MAQMATEDVMALIAGGVAVDERLFVKFNAQAVENEKKSLEEGRPIYDQVDYIKIAQPGDQTSITHTPVTNCGARQQCRNAPTNRCHVHRFPRAYAAYKGGLDQETASGTPLSMWPILNVAQVEELKHFRVCTVEQLADLADSAIQGIGPIQNLKQQAKLFVEAARGNAPLLKMAAELRERDDRLAAMQNAIETQKAQIDNLIRQQSQAANAGVAAVPQIPAGALEQKTEKSGKGASK